MGHHARYDVVIVGAGPAGLSAARTLARLGYQALVLERQPAPGDLGHPCHGLLSPVPGFIRSERQDDGFHYPEIDLVVPHSVVVGCPLVRRYLSPDGQALADVLARGPHGSSVVVDKVRLLDTLADRAASAGAELQFGNAATALVWAGRRVVGVTSVRGQIDADVVILAEGSSCQLAAEAGTHERPRVDSYAVTVSQEMAVLDRGCGDLGYLTTFGKRYSSAPRAFGTVVIPAPGRATVSFTVFDDRPRHPSDPLLWSYLDQYQNGDERVRDLLGGARILNRAAYQRALGDDALQLVRDGFVVAGDAVAPGGHMGVLPAMYVGRSAALVVAGALDAGDPSSTALASYDQLLRGSVLSQLGQESRALWELTGMTDEEINRLFLLLGKLHRSEPFLAGWESLPWLAAKWLVDQSPLLADDYHLLQRFMSEPSRSGGKPGQAHEELPIERLRPGGASPY